MSMNDVSDSGFEARRLRRELIDDDLLDRLIQSTSDRGWGVLKMLDSH